MKILNLLAEGGIGGIETLCNSIDNRNNMNNYWCFFNQGGEIADEIKSRNPDKTYILNEKTTMRKIIKEINNICETNKIDIIAMHHNGLQCNILFHYLVKSNKENVKFVRLLHACHEDKYFFPNNKIKSMYGLYCYNRAFKEADLLISVSKAVQKSFEEKFDIQKIRKTVIYNGINDKFLKTEIRKRENIKNRKCKIIYVGRLIKVKGVDILINAIKELKDENYNIQLTIVGDGEERENLERLVKELEIGEIVQFVGKQRNVIDWLDKSDISVYPSVWKEAFGISVAEAMARECIPIVSDRGGLTEIVDDKLNGYVVKNLNSDNVANTIKECIDKEIEGNGIDRKEIRKKAEEFTIDRTIERLKEEYEKLMK